MHDGDVEANDSLNQEVRHEKLTMRHIAAAGESHDMVDKRHLITDVRERQCPR